MRVPTLTMLGALGLAITAGLSADPFADAVVEFAPGDFAGFGQGFLPNNVLGQPEGGDTTFTPQDQESELLSLGHGGSITLQFIDNAIVDGPGVDFLVFENVLVNTVDSNPFVEVATIEVSENGTDFVAFPFDMVPPDPPTPPATLPTITASNFPLGFAGVSPTLTNSTNGVDPTDPNVAGGDGFDLADVGLSTVRYVRITDGGLQGTATQRTDDDGDVIVDDGDFPPLNTGTSAGFDLDAVVAVNSEATTAASHWDLWR